MIFRIEKTQNYTVMSNFHLRDKNLSLKAKGLLSWMLSNPDDWDYSIAGIVSCCKEGESSINSTLNELKEAGYIEVIKHKPDSSNNRIHYEYRVFEMPKKPESQDGGFLGLESQGLENPGQINNKKINTKKRNKILSKDNITEPTQNFSLGSKREKKESLYSYCIAAINEFSNDESIRKMLIQYLNLRLEMKNEKPLYKNSWKGCLSKLKREFKESEWKEVIQQSIDRAYGSFFPVNKSKYTRGNFVDNIPRKFVDENGKVDNYPDEDHSLSDMVF